MIVTAGFGTGARNFTVTRGADGTTGVAHISGSYVAQVLTAEGLAAATDLLYNGDFMSSLMPNSSFDADLSGWTLANGGGGTTPTRITSGTKSGAGALSLVNTVAGADAYMYGRMTASPSTVYTASVWVNASVFTAAAIANRGLFVYDIVGTTSEVKLTAATAGWVLLTATITKAPTANTLEVRLYAPQGTTGWDEVSVVAGSSAANYKDGDIVVYNGVAYLCVRPTSAAPIGWTLGSGGGGGADLRYNGAYAGANYTDGDIVIGADGISYLCVKPTSAAPTPWAAAPFPGRPVYGTTLPASPYDGQEAILVDSITAPTYQWRFRYNAQSTSPYKWEYVGGTSATAYIGTGESTTTTATWLDLATVGPRVIVPRAGDYDASAVSSYYTSSAANGYPQIGVCRGTIGPFGVSAAVVAPSVGYAISISADGIVVDVTAGGDIRIRYYVAQPAGTHNFLTRWIRVTPRRVA